ncbi:hypothetical protein CVV43_03675 [Candidatus Saccharibacteria bacterium HGW-Saccharibacteria-1]|nr:MAG: hypothetical protein CVV43_03675 [Candidatus Saccharibacteria bacterium HGW-Saccharibacteria-1]
MILSVISMLETSIVKSLCFSSGFELLNNSGISDASDNRYDSVISRPLLLLDSNLNVSLS